MQDFQRFMPVDILMPADAEASLPMLIEFVKQAITGERKTVFEQRGAALASPMPRHANSGSGRRWAGTQARSASPG